MGVRVQVRVRPSARARLWGGEGKGDANGWSERQDLIACEPRRDELTRLRRGQQEQRVEAGGGVGLKGLNKVAGGAAGGARWEAHLGGESIGDLRLLLGRLRRRLFCLCILVDFLCSRTSSTLCDGAAAAAGGGYRRR